MSGPAMWFHTPGAAEEAFPYHVVAGGWRVARPGDAPVARRFHQHVFILTVEGTGLVRQAGRRRRAGPGTLVWLDTQTDYEHRCQGAAAIWRYHWIGVHGFGLDVLYEQAAAAVDPVTALADPAAALRCMDAIHGAMAERGALQGAANAAAVASLLAQVLADRRRPLVAARPAVLRPIDRALSQMRLALPRPWSIADLTEVTSLSVSQLHRSFRAETGLSPMAWLRQERINAAKPLLLDPAYSIRAVAEAIGYLDPFHFSRDFKALTGRAPLSFRRSGGA